MSINNEKNSINNIFFKCFSNNPVNKVETQSNIIEDLNKIPDDEFICIRCGKIPEILSIHNCNGTIEYKCEKCGLIDISIKDYFLKFKDSPFNYLNTEYMCQKCQKHKKDEDTFNYCYNCQKILCKKCSDDKNIHPQGHLHKFEKINKIKNKSRKYYNENYYIFCKDCNKNICQKDEDKHKAHKTENLCRYYKDANEYKKKKIKTKIESLSEQYRFNKLILNTTSKFQNNYFYMQSVINLGKSIEKENSRDSKDIDCFLEKLTQDFNYQRNIIKEFKNITGYYLKANNKFLHLSYIDEKEKKYNNENIEINNNQENKVNNDQNNNKEKREKISDESFKLVSLIHFNQLKEIDASNNLIKNIEPLSKMLLPFLEYLNFSFNLIDNIEPIANLKCNELEEILLIENKITDINPFENSIFPNLKLLRVENNNIDLNKISENLKKKFKKQLIIEKKTLEDIKKYNPNNLISNNNSTIYLFDAKGGDIMLKDLYFYLTLIFNNNIKKLNLMNNEINDPSILCKIRFPNLEILDLSVNNIKNLKFLFKMKCRNLNSLFLNDNKINNISPLMKLVKEKKTKTEEEKNKEEKRVERKEEEEDESGQNKFKNLEIISLRDNILYYEDEKNKKIFDYLKKNGIKLDIFIDENK